MKKILLASLAFLGLASKAEAVFPIFGYVQVSTANVVVPAQQGGTMNVSSGTVANFTCTTCTVNGLNVSSLTVSGPFTEKSSATIQGNLGVLGQINQPLTVTSTATFNANIGFNTVNTTATFAMNVAIDGVLTASGSATLGGNGNSVTISSNTVFPGATFYQNAGATLGSVYTINVSSNGVLPGATFYQNASIQLSNPLVSNTSLYGIGAVFQVVCASVTASSATVTSQFANTNLSVTLTPHSATDLIVGFTAITTFNTNLNSQNNFDIARNGTRLGQAGGWILFVEPVANNDGNASFPWWDLPGAAVSTTYTLQFRTNVGTVQIADGTVNSLCVADIGK